MSCGGRTLVEVVTGAVAVVAFVELDQLQSTDWPLCIKRTVALKNQKTLLLVLVLEPRRPRRDGVDHRRVRRRPTMLKDGPGLKSAHLGEHLKNARSKYFEN